MPFNVLVLCDRGEHEHERDTRKVARDRANASLLKLAMITVLWDAPVAAVEEASKVCGYLVAFRVLHGTSEGLPVPCAL